MNDKGCFLDTTVLAEALLKPQDKRKKARDKIREYQRSVLPVYAIKEFQFGPFRYFIWLHNKLVDTRSISRTIRTIHNSFHKPYLKGSMEEALEVGTEMLIGAEFSGANTREKTQVAIADSVRFHIRCRIDIAWRERRKFTTEVVDALSCYPEVAPSYNEETHYIDTERLECDLLDECCLAEGFRKRRSDLHKLIVAMKNLDRSEDKKRRAALYLLLERPKKLFGDRSCKALGDAIFALQCPKDCVILTSNDKDHVVLAGALRKEVHKHRV